MWNKETTDHKQPLFACLPWYDLTEIQPNNDRLWQSIAKQLRANRVADIPDTLDRMSDYQSQWGSPNLLLGQACGYDVFCANEHALQIVGAPRYRFSGCSGVSYRSYVIVKNSSRYKTLEDLRHTRCVINSPRSHSGMNVLQSMVASLAVDGRFFDSIQISGAHERSMQMISAGNADVAAIDCITFGLLQQHRPEALQNMRIICETHAQTAPPYVTSAQTSQRDIGILLESMQAAVTQLAAEDRAALGLIAIEPATLASYEGIGKLQRHAEDSDYTELHYHIQ